MPIKGRSWIVHVTSTSTGYNKQFLKEYFEEKSVKILSKYYHQICIRNEKIKPGFFRDVTINLSFRTFY